MTLHAEHLPLSSRGLGHRTHLDRSTPGSTGLKLETRGYLPRVAPNRATSYLLGDH